MRVTLLRRALLALLVLAAVVVAWTLLVLLAVRGDVTAAREALEGARIAEELEAALPALDRAEDELSQAVSRLDQPGPALVAVLPGVGRPVRAVDTTAQATLSVVRSTAEVLDVVDAPEPLLQDGAVDLAALRSVGEALGRAAESTRGPVTALRTQPTGGLPGALSGPVEQAKQELGGAPDAFTRAAAAVRGLVGVLGADQPRRLLVLLQNNAELRGSGGVVTVFAEVTADDGALEIGSFRDVEDVADGAADAVAVDAPDDYEQLWGPFLANTTLWKNANMSPDLPTSSAVLADIAALSLETPPDALLWIDVPAIAAVLEATGPAQLPDGRELSAGNAVETLLSQAYLDAPDTREGQARRRATLRGAADAVLGRLLGRGGSTPSLTTLGPALADAAAGRHLALWSAVPAEQADLVAARLAGANAADGADLASVAVQNLGGGDREGNKLDYYSRRRISVRAVLDQDEAVVEQQVVLRNTAPPDGLPTYVAGGGTPGTTNNLVALALPRGAELLEFSRGGRSVASPPQPSGDHQVVVDLVNLASGTEVSWTLRYRLPVDDGAYRLTLVPQPLAFPADLDVEVVARDGLHLRTDPSGALVAGEDGGLVLLEQFDAERELAVEVARPGWAGRAVDAVREFWNEPLPRP